MTNNEIFKELLHLFSIERDDELIIEIFQLGGISVTRSKIRSWRITSNTSRYSYMRSQNLMHFLAGLRKYRDNQLTNNVKIFNLQRNIDDK